MIKLITICYYLKKKCMRNLFKKVSLHLLFHLHVIINIIRLVVINLDLKILLNSLYGFNFLIISSSKCDNV